MTERTTRLPSCRVRAAARTRPRCLAARSRVAPIDWGLICSSRASALEVAGPPRSSRASAEVSGTVSSPADPDLAHLAQQQPDADAEGGRDIVRVGISGHTLSLN